MKFSSKYWKDFLTSFLWRISHSSHNTRKEFLRQKKNLPKEKKSMENSIRNEDLKFLSDISSRERKNMKLYFKYFMFLLLRLPHNWRRRRTLVSICETRANTLHIYQTSPDFLTVKSFPFSYFAETALEAQCVWCMTD